MTEDELRQFHPWYSKSKKTITINLDNRAIVYFKGLSEETGVPYQTLINLYLVQCAEERSVQCLYSKKNFRIVSKGMKISQTTLQQIIAAVHKMYIQQYENNLKKVYLYGSYARGDFNDSSDIDITAIVDGERRELQEKLKAIWDDTADLGYENDIIISPSVIPYKEFEDYKNILPYYMNIEQEGIEING